MQDLDTAILRTILYADVFRFPMAAREIHHFLIAENPCSQADVEEALSASSRLAEALIQSDGWVALAGHADQIGVREEREAASTHLMLEARRYGRWLACVPFVRMVAITGALAMHNAASAQDDVDYVLVTAPGRVWLARACAILVVRLARFRGIEVCPNYVLAETALAQDRRDLYIAHEIAQMIPLFGFAVYDAMRARNAWAFHFLANACAPFHPETEQRPGTLAGAMKRMAEWALGDRLGNALEGWESRRKMRRFQAQMAHETHSARLDGEHVKGHFNDHGQRVLHQYALRLQEYGLEDTPVAISEPA